VAFISNSKCITTSKTYDSQNDISTQKASQLPNSKGFMEVFDDILNNISLPKSKFDISKENTQGPVNTSISYNDIVSMGGKTKEELLQEAKAQEKFNQDIKRIATMMGVKPAFVMALFGNVNIDPKNLDFKIETNADQAVNDIAQHFGISPMTMLAIFDKLIIDPKDLEYKEESGKIISKLKDFFRLNKDQEQDLKEIIEKYATKSKMNH